VRRHSDHYLTDRVRARVRRRNEPQSMLTEFCSSHGRVRLLALALALKAVPAAAQDESRIFAGALFGVSALSADARSVVTGADAAVSQYDPKNGPALNVFAGVHVAQYLAIQVNWMWNRNDLTLFSSHASPQAGSFYEQTRDSSQHALVFDGLIYFRRLDSSIRPYLGTGLSVLHFSSEEAAGFRAQGLIPPAGEITSTRIGLRSHVGIDFRLSRHIAFRYSFSETISGNPISPSLTPQGERGLMNFQNLFGFVSRF
jgi:outer membrane protein W